VGDDAARQHHYEYGEDLMVRRSSGVEYYDGEVSSDP
jgi:hypothetical protein